MQAEGRKGIESQRLTLSLHCQKRKQGGFVNPERGKNAGSRSPENQSL